jgi:hypothetical protein
VTRSNATAQSDVLPAEADQAWSAAVTRVANNGNPSWSLPVFFRPDGTASDAAFNVIAPSGSGFQLSVRELTGEITVQRLVQGTL